MIHSMCQSASERDETIASASHHCRQLVEGVRIQPVCMEQKYLRKFRSNNLARLRFVESKNGVDVADVALLEYRRSGAITLREHRIIDASKRVIVVVDGYWSDHVTVPRQELVKRTLFVDMASGMEKGVAKVLQFAAVLRHERTSDFFTRQNVMFEVAEASLVQALVGERVIAQIEASL